jgi:hypothetical protein
MVYCTDAGLNCASLEVRQVGNDGSLCLFNTDIAVENCR